MRNVFHFLRPTSPLVETHSATALSFTRPKNHSDPDPDPERNHKYMLIVNLMAMS